MSSTDNNLETTPDIRAFITEHYKEAEKSFMTEHTGLPWYTIKYIAKKLGVRRGDFCRHCGKRVYKKKDGKWICSDCYWSICGGRCIDCNRPVAKRSIRCLECGRKYVGDLNRKYEQKYCYCGRKIPHQNRTCGRKKCQLKWKLERGTLLERTCGHCGKIFYVTRYRARVKAAKYCSPQCYYAEWIPTMGKKAKKFGKYNMRSTWEVRIAQLLTVAKIEFQYEPRKIDGYIPDFYLPEYDLWIEVKGFMNARSIEKITKFKEAGYNLLVIDKVLYNKISSFEDIVQLLSTGSGVG